MADFSIFTRFGAKDKITPSFRDMDRGAKRFGKGASKSFRDATASASRFRDVTKSILAAGAITRGLSILSRGIGDVTRQFVDFDKATIGAAARFKDIGPNAVDFEEQLRKIRDRAREAGATTEFTAAQAGAALDFLARAGFTSAEAFGSLDSMINLATASGEDFATVADFSSDLLGAFGLNVDDTAQKIKNLSRLNDVLVKSANSANVTIESQFETMKQAAPVARIVGASLEEVAALTATLGNAGIKGGDGATALKNAMLRLAAPAGEAQQALDFLNITTDDGEGNMKKITAILGEVRDGLKGVGEVKQAKVLNALFGKRAIAGAKNLIEALEGVDKFEQILLDAAGTSEATADRMRKSLGNRLLALGSAASEFGFKIIEAFEVRGEGAIDALTKAVRKFDPNPIINGIELAVGIFKNLWAVLKPFTPFLPWFIGMWAAYAATLKILGVAQAITGFITLTTTLLGTALGAAGAAVNFIAFATTLLSSAGAMGTLNAVMAANPVGAIIVAIAALIGLLVFVVKNFDNIKLGWDVMLRGMKTALEFFETAFIDIFGGIIKFGLKAMKKVFGVTGRDTSEIDRLLEKIDEFERKKGINQPLLKAPEAGQFFDQLQLETPERQITGRPQPETLGRQITDRQPLNTPGREVTERPQPETLGRQVTERPSVETLGREVTERQQIDTLERKQTIDESKRTAPNKEEAEARRDIGFEGRIRFENTPPGTTAESKTTGAPDIDMELLGSS